MKEKKQKKKRGIQKKYKNNQKISNKMAISTYLLCTNVLMYLRTNINTYYKY